jgi:hypothetical protein
MNALRETEGAASKGDYLRFFKRARQELINSMTDDVIQAYKTRATADTARRRAPPTPQTISEYTLCHCICCLSC